jgi:hypothetical protein
MSAETKPPQPSREPRAEQPRWLFALWLEILGPPVIWLTQFEIKYILAARVATARHSIVLIGVWVVAVALIAALAVFARHQEREAATPPLDRYAGIAARTRFMSVVGLMSCALFALLIVAQGLADFFFEPGEK